MNSVSREKLGQDIQYRKFHVLITVVLSATVNNRKLWEASTFLSIFYFYVASSLPMIIILF